MNNQVNIPANLPEEVVNEINALVDKHKKDSLKDIESGDVFYMSGYGYLGFVIACSPWNRDEYTLFGLHGNPHESFSDKVGVSKKEMIDYLYERGYTKVNPDLVREAQTKYFKTLIEGMN